MTKALGGILGAVTIISVIITLAMPSAAATPKPEIAPRTALVPWTNHATGIAIRLPESWIYLPRPPSPGRDLPGYPYVFANNETADRATYDCNDRYASDNLYVFSQAFQADNSSVIWDGPFEASPDIRDSIQWQTTGRLKAGNYPVAAFATVVGPVFCTLTYTATRDTTGELTYPVFTDVLFWAARKKPVPPTLFNPQTGSMVVVPAPWIYKPGIVDVRSDLAFAMFTHPQNTALGQYGCEDDTGIDDVAEYADTLMAYLPDVRWDAASAKPLDADTIEVPAMVTSDNGVDHWLLMMVKKIGPRFCSLAYRADTEVPDLENYKLLVNAIFGPDVRP